jgi:hypothetical protein
MTPIRSGAPSITPELFHASLVGLRWDLSRQRRRERLVDAIDKYKKFLIKRGREKRTKYFGSGGDVLADDPNTVKAVRK